MIDLSLDSLKIINYSMFKSLEMSKNTYHKVLSYLSLHFDNTFLYNITLDKNEENSLALSYNKSNKVYDVSFPDFNIFDIFDKNSPIISISNSLSKEDVKMICENLSSHNYSGIVVSNSEHITYDNFFFNVFIKDPLKKIKISDNSNIISTIKSINFTNKQSDINLYFSYYNDKNEIRQKELNICLETNISNPIFKKIVIVNENGDYNFIQDTINKYKNQIKTKILIIDSNYRYKFKDFFNLANTFISKKEEINILINTDIIVGKGFSNLKLSDDNFICLSRYEIENDNNINLAVGGGSHDCWIWKGYIKSENIGDFYTGKYLCDGVLANQLYNKGYSLKNPVYGLFIYHYHLSNIRNYHIYTLDDCVRGNRKGAFFSQNDNIFLNSVYDDGYN